MIGFLKQPDALLPPQLDADVNVSATSQTKSSNGGDEVPLKSERMATTISRAVTRRQPKVFHKFTRIACIRSDSSAAEGKRSSAAVVAASRPPLVPAPQSPSAALFRRRLGASFDGGAQRRYFSMVEDVVAASLTLNVLSKIGGGLLVENTSSGTIFSLFLGLNSLRRNLIRKFLFYD